MSYYDELVKLSAEAIEDPRAGDHWHEMYSWHLIVVAVDDNTVTTMSGNPPISFPADAGVKRETRTRDEFKKYLSYGCIPGTWANCSERGIDVGGWMQEYDEALRARIAKKMIA